jgi:hypothetical protein
MCPYFVSNNTDFSFADPDPNPGWVKNQDPGCSCFRELRKNTVLKFFDMDPDPGSWIRNLFDPGSGIRNGKVRIRDKHPGPAHCLR